jgi:flagellar biogenesis protein FliO
MRGGASSSSIDILGMRALGPREQLVVVRIEDRILVLGHTSAQINLVTELESYTAESPVASVGAGFQEQLQRWLRRKQP